MSRSRRRAAANPPAAGAAGRALQLRVWAPRQPPAALHAPRRSAACASRVMASHSSRMISLNLLLIHGGEGREGGAAQLQGGGGGGGLRGHNTPTVRGRCVADPKPQPTSCRPAGLRRSAGAASQPQPASQPGPQPVCPCNCTPFNPNHAHLKMVRVLAKSWISLRTTAMPRSSAPHGMGLAWMAWGAGGTACDACA